NAVLLDVLDLREHCCLSFERFAAFEIHFKESESRKCIQSSGAGGNETFLIAHIPVQNRRATFTQNRGKDLQGASVVAENTRSVKSQRNVTFLNGTALPSISRFLLVRLGRTAIAFQRGVVGGNGAIEFHNFGDSLFDIHLARNRQDDIGRPIVLLYVGYDVVTRQRSQAFGCAYPPTFHPMLMESGLIELFGSYGRWIVELSIVFLENDLYFFLELASVVDGIQKGVGLNFQSLFQVLGRHFGVIDGTVIVRKRV